MHAGTDNEQHKSSYTGGGADRPAAYTEVRCRSRLTDVGPHTWHHFNTDGVHSGSLSALLSIRLLAGVGFVLTLTWIYAVMQ